MGIMEGIQMPAFAGFRRGLVSGNQGGGAVVGSVVNQAVIVFFDLAAGGRVPGVLYGSGPPDAPGCLLVAMRRVGAGLDWLEESAALWGAYPPAAPSHVGRSRPFEDGPAW